MRTPSARQSLRARAATLVASSTAERPVNHEDLCKALLADWRNGATAKELAADLAAAAAARPGLKALTSGATVTYMIRTGRILELPIGDSKVDSRAIMRAVASVHENVKGSGASGAAAKIEDTLGAAERDGLDQAGVLARLKSLTEKARRAAKAPTSVAVATASPCSVATTADLVAMLKVRLLSAELRGSASFEDDLVSLAELRDTLTDVIDAST